MTDIGQPERTIEIEPLVIPVPSKEPKPEPEKAPAPKPEKEPVPA